MESQPERALIPKNTLLLFNAYQSRNEAPAREGIDTMEHTCLLQKIIFVEMEYQLERALILLNREISNDNCLAV